MIYYVLGILVLPVALFYLAKLLWRVYILWTARDPNSTLDHLPIPPGDYGIPLVGETFTWAVQGSRFNIIRREKYGKVFSTNYIGRTMVKVTGPEHVKQILAASHQDVSTIWPTTVRRVLGESSIANSVGIIHKYRRKAFLKVFNHASLNCYIPKMHEAIKDRMTRWVNEPGVFLVHPQTKEMTFDVAFHVLVGLQFADEDERKKLFETFDTMITNLFSLPYEIPGSGFCKALKARRTIHSLLDHHLIEKRKKIRQMIADGEYAAESEDQTVKNALHFILEAEYLDTISKQNNKDREDSPEKDDDVQNHATNADDDVEDRSLSDMELKETTVEMLFAGYQTTASAATSAVINLIKHPEVFRKIEDEMRQFGFLPDSDKPSDSDLRAKHQGEIILNGNITEQNSDSGEAINTASDFTNNNDIRNPKKIEPESDQHSVDITEGSEAPITLELLSKMHYLEQVLRETLRIMPPILGGYRMANRTFQLGKYRIPKGWTIIYNIRDTHESEWSEDMEFNPDRFSQENWKENRESRFRWIPFGGGPRICVGKEFARLQIKLFVIEFVRHFRNIEFAKGKPPPMFAIPFLHPTDGLPVKLTPRLQPEENSVAESKKMK